MQYVDQENKTVLEVKQDQLIKINFNARNAHFMLIRFFDSDRSSESSK